MNRRLSWSRRLFGTRRGLIILSLFLLGVAALGLALSRTGISGRATRRAEFYFVQNRPFLYANYTFPVELWVKSPNAAVNAAGAVVRFDPRVVDIVSMNTERSFCSLYLENSFDTIKGEVRVACGTPQPGFQGESLLVTIMIKPKVTGISEVTLAPDDSLILGNGDRPTSLLSGSLPSLPLTIKQTF